MSVTNASLPIEMTMTDEGIWKFLIGIHNKLILYKITRSSEGKFLIQKQINKGAFSTPVCCDTFDKAEDCVRIDICFYMERGYFEGGTYICDLPTPLTFTKNRLTVEEFVSLLNSHFIDIKSTNNLVTTQEGYVIAIRDSMSGMHLCRRAKNEQHLDKGKEQSC